MYRHILGLLEGFCGDKARYVLAVGLFALAVSVVLLLLPPWQRAVRAAWEKGGWRGIVLGLAHGLMSVFIGGTIVAALGGALLVQSGTFNDKHGNVTQANYEAIQTNWGPPHEQAELAVAHYVVKEQTVYLLKDGKEVVKEDEDDAVPPPADAPKAEKDADDSAGDTGVAKTFRRKVRKEIPQNSIASATIDVDVTMNYRQKGPAYYTCYEDAWKLDYLVKNRSGEATEAEFRFNLPADQGIWNDFVILVNGKDWAEHVVGRGGGQTWKMPMKPDEEARVQVTYKSRGMERIRYTPAILAHRENYKVTMRIRPDPNHGKQAFTWKEDMSLPMGCMTPTVIRDAPGQPMTLEWDLSKAATTLGMGVLLPNTPPAGYYVRDLLHEAPLGLMLLAGMLVATWTLLGREADLFSLALLAVVYYLFYTFIAYLSDLVPSFEMCFALAAGATLLGSALYLWLGWGRNFASHQTLALVAAFTVYYPLAVVADSYTGLLAQILYWTLAVYVAMLMVTKVWQRRRAAT